MVWPVVVRVSTFIWLTQTTGHKHADNMAWKTKPVAACHGKSCICQQLCSVCKASQLNTTDEMGSLSFEWITLLSQRLVYVTGDGVPKREGNYMGCNLKNHCIEIGVIVSAQCVVTHLEGRILASLPNITRQTSLVIQIGWMQHSSYKQNGTVKINGLQLLSLTQFYIS